ncbi:hypothetical protein KAU39_00950, partial [bacterium]|nr:hypothetical protein [bacterium]
CLLLLGLTACNIFEFLHRPKGSTDEHIARGERCLANKDYGGAVSAFRDAMECDPGNSDARYGYSKAYARLYLKRDIFDLAADFSEEEAVDYLFNFAEDEIDSIYNVSHEVRTVLSDVYYGRCHGTIQRQNVYMGYGVSCALEAITYALIQFRGIMWKLNDLTGGFTLDGLHKLLDEHSPEEAAAIINDIIDTVEGLLPLAAEAFTAALGEESQEIKDEVSEILEDISKYHCADGIDNDGDAGHSIDAGWGNGIDEEALDGIDNDGDGLVDEDSHL